MMIAVGGHHMGREQSLQGPVHAPGVPMLGQSSVVRKAYHTADIQREQGRKLLRVR